MDLMCRCAVLALSGLALASVPERALAETSPSMLALAKRLDDLDYDKHIRPGHHTGKPVDVAMLVILTSISGIDEVNMDMDIDLFIQRRWVDERLVNLTQDALIQVFGVLETRIWQPHVYFVNSKASRYHNVTTWVREVHIEPRTGRVYSNVRVTIKLSCPMELTFFPMDRQTCSLKLEGGHPMDFVSMRWAGVDPVTVNKLTLPKFNMLKPPEPGTCKQSYLSVNYSCLELEITMVRQFGYFLIQVYAPTFCLVIMSWVSFWLTVDASPARTALGTITVLTVTTQTGSVNNSVPKVSYVKAMDVWFIACICFVFAAFLEFAVVNSVYRYTRKRRLKHLERKRRRVLELKEATVIGNSIFWVNGEEKEAAGAATGAEGRHNSDHTNDITYQITEHDESSLGCQCCRFSSDIIDRVSRWVFPAIFAVFNAIYWPSYGQNAYFGDWDNYTRPNQTISYGLTTMPPMFNYTSPARDFLREL